ncbi:MAG: T9SS C-terminal target domain-containing protein [Cytophagia bacterium]|nr:MAG: T9SS C-terminal target domain-containing protein [Cytophagia bacterium]
MYFEANFSLPKGVYFVHIIQNNNRVVKKIVVE